MVLFPNAKINIGLNILQKRADGYHDIETLFYPVGLKDALEYVENGSGRVSLTCSGMVPDIPTGQNIVVKAYRLLQEERALPGLDIHLHKAIPSGAGLGGGSADAAFFLKSLNEHFELGLSGAKLSLLAGKLGADCSFFLVNRPAIATGTGEILTPSDLSLSGYYLLLVKPSFGIDTKEAYAGVRPEAYPYSFSDILHGGIRHWKEKIRNGFEKSLFLEYPELHELKKRFYGEGAEYASMSGSGSSVYALFRQNPGLGPADFPPGYFVWQEELT